MFFSLLIVNNLWAIKAAPPVYDPFPDTIFCKGNSLVLDAGAGFLSYVWNTAATTQTITANQTGWYGVTVTDANGTYNDTVFVSLLGVNIYPRDSILTVGQSMILTIDTTTKTTVPILHMAGNFNNWNPAGKQIVASIPNNGYYEAYYNIPVSNDSLKFTSDPDWNHTVYGMGASSGTLSTDKAAPNIIFNSTENAVYKIGVNTTTLTNDITEITTFGVVGDAALGWGTDLPMQLDTSNRIWYGNYSLNTGHIKFRANNSWTTNYGAVNTDSTLVSYGADILIPAAGTYFIAINMSNPTRYTYQIINQQTPLLLHPTTVWSTGDTTASITVTPNVTTTYYCTRSNGISTVTDSVTLYIPTYITGNITTPLNYNLANVDIFLTGNGYVKSDTTVTDSTGNFLMKAMTGDSYLFKPNKNNDINKSNGVTSLDLALTQSHILAKNLLNSPYKIIAADVNGDGKVTALDLVYMKRLILGVDTTFTNSKTGEKRLWTFINPNFVFADSSNPFPYQDSAILNSVNAVLVNLNVLGFKLGDVNWDWNPAIAKIPGPVFVRPKIILLRNNH